MADKMTKRELFTTLIGVVQTLDVTDGDIAIAEQLVAGLQHEVELLDRKRDSSKGDAKKKAEQASVKREIRATLADGEAMRATAIAEQVGVSVQKVSALVRQMVADGEVARHEDKKVTTFTLV